MADNASTKMDVRAAGRAGLGPRRPRRADGTGRARRRPSRGWGPAGRGRTKNDGQGEPMRLIVKFGGYQEPASIHNRAAARFGELLERQLGDRVRFELIGSILKLGRPSGDLVPMVERGELSFCYMSTVRFSKAAPHLQLLELPFIVKDRGAVFKALDGEYGEAARQRVTDNTACRLLGYWDNGFRHLTNRVRPIRTPEDCRGLRIRTQMSDLHGEVFRALGFEPIAADVKEFVEQIGHDRFEAQDNPLTNIYNFGVHRYHRYITLS